jgi:hypothetical protein
VALQGTLDTFSLPDVLRLLATTGKTGCLHVDGDRGRGRVWIDGGAVVAATADRALGEPSIDEVVFEMLRFGRGSFSFAIDEPAPHDAQPTEIEGMLRRATQLLEEWRELEAIVPSLNHRVAMAPELTVEQVTVDADRWKALVAIASGRSVGELAEALGVGELGITRAVSDLVELGVAVVEPPATGRSNGSSRRNVTEISTRAGESRRSSRSDVPRREPAPASDGAPQVNWAQTADPVGRSDAADLGRSASGTRMSNRSSAAPQVNGANVLSPSSRMAPEATISAAAAVGVVTPASGTPSIDTSPKSRRSAGTSSRAPRSRRAPSTPSGGQPSLGGPTRGGSTLPVPPPVDMGLAAMPAPVGEPLTTGPIFPPTLETSPPSGLALPSSFDTGRLGPSPLPTDTGQIPVVSSSALPADLSWAAEDDEAHIAPPGPKPAPAPLRSSTPPPARLIQSAPSPRPAPGQAPPQNHGDPALHVVAMSDAARAAVEATVGRSGGGPAGMPMAGASQEQILNRGQLFRYLTSVHG